MKHISDECKSALLDLAIAVLRQGVVGEQQDIDLHVSGAIPELKSIAACFVTLEKAGALRGCIGSLRPSRELYKDVAHNAYCAGFCDPRFEPLTVEELPGLVVTISVLGDPEQMVFYDKADLLSQIVPHQDGLIVKQGHRRATFLPSVWQILPTAELFLAELLQKAGLAENYWSTSIEFERYHTISFGRTIAT